MRLDLRFSDLGVVLEEDGDDSLFKHQAELMECYNDELHYYGPFPPGAIHYLTALLEGYSKASDTIQPRAALLIRRAHLHVGLLKFSLAEQDLSLILLNTPLHVGALDLRSIVLCELGQYTEALVDLKVYLSICDDSFRIKRAYYNALIYFKNDLLDNALVYIEQLLENTPALLNTGECDIDITDVLNLRYQIYAKQEKWPEALIDLTTLLEKKPDSNPKYYDFLWARAELYLKQNNVDAARQDLDEYLNQFPSHVQGLTYRYDLCRTARTRNEIIEQGSEDYRTYQQALLEADHHARQMVLDEYALSGVSMPSLVTLCKMTFFKHEPNLYSTGAVLKAVDKAPKLRKVLHETEINPLTLSAMHERLRPHQVCVDTVFDQLSRQEEIDAYQNKRQKY
jgi:tetratricopeptide (TPR) repeat protein